jgi:hypothetical protein
MGARASEGNVGKGALGMHVLQIEHPIGDFDTWKGAFDRFSTKRQESGVRHHQVFRPTDDPN